MVLVRLLICYKYVVHDFYSMGAAFLLTGFNSCKHISDDVSTNIGLAAQPSFTGNLPMYHSFPVVNFVDCRCRFLLGKLKPELSDGFAQLKETLR